MPKSNRRGVEVPLRNILNEYWFYGKDVQPNEMIFDNWRDYAEFSEFYTVIKTENCLFRTIPASNELKEEGCTMQFVEVKNEGRGAYWVTCLTVKRKKVEDS